MQLVLLILGFISFMCFCVWVRANGADFVPSLKKLAYFLGPVHFVSSIIFYGLFTFSYGSFFNGFSVWFSILCYAFIATNVWFCYWLRKKNKEKMLLDFVYDLPHATDLFQITLLPHAFLLLFLASAQSISSVGFEMIHWF